MEFLSDLWLSDTLTDRVAVSGATRVLDDEEAARNGYAPQALIPLGPWRAPTEAEHAALFGISTNYCPWSRGVSIGVASSSLREAIAQTRPLRIQSQDDANSASRTAEVDHLSGLFSELLRERSLYHDPPPKILGVSVKPSGLPTATMNRTDGLRIGLHLDSWDRREFRARDLCRNRICINLGEEDRFLLFCNVTITTIVMDLKDEDHRYHSSAELIRRFFERHPSYPIVRMRLAPGEFYIAPTENIIHDATTIGKKKPDIALSALGYFRL